MKLFACKAPAGRLMATYEQALETGCIQAQPGEELFAGLMLHTGCSPCNGCPAYSRQCKTFAAFHSSVPRPVASNPPTLKCEKCGLKIRGTNHAEHCKGKK
jgi:hypothetical protein